MELKKIEQTLGEGNLCAIFYIFRDLLFFYVNKTVRNLESEGTYAQVFENVGKCLAIFFTKIVNMEC